MFEYQGWASILASYYENDEAEDFFEKYIAKDLIERFKKISNHNLESNIRCINGQLRCWFIGFSNRCPQEWREFLEFFHLLAEVAPGSYGIMSCRDDENVKRYNEFQVFLLKKGHVVEATDTFLSPCVPEIEEI